MKKDTDKTKEQLLAKLAALRKKSKEQEEKLKAANQQLDLQNQQLQASEQMLKEEKHKLNERVKELNCLYRISESVRTKETLEEILQDVTEVIPPSWQYPQITGSKITLGDKEYKTENYKDTQWKLSSDLIVNKKIAGKIEVCYLEKKPESDIGTFLHEERILLDDIAERLGRIIEKNNAEEALNKINQELEERVRKGTAELAAANQQLKAQNQQLQATEQQLRAANQQLTAGEAKFKSYIQNAPDGVFIVNENRKFIEVNKAACEITGYSEDELLKLTIPELIQEEYTEKVKHHFQTLVKEGFAISELGIVTKSGEKRFLSVDAVKLSETRFLGFAKDITKRKQAEQELTKLSTVVTQSPLLIEITDTEGNIEYVNPKFTELTGYRLEEAIGQKPRILQSGKHTVERYKALWETISSGKTWRGEFLNKKKNGELFWTLSAISPIFDEKGKIINYLDVAEDITRRKQAEEQLRKLNTELESRVEQRTEQLTEAKLEAERANLAKSEFLSRMSHELRTPMNSILGFAQLMEMGELAPVHKKRVHQIIKSGKHLLQLINEVLDMSKIEAGTMSVSLEPVQLKGIIAEIMDVVYPLAEKQNISVKFLETPACNLFVQADGQKLKQVLLNLINNAIKYNKENGSVKVECNLLTQDRSKQVIRISVIDTGKGIAKEDMQKLFTPFERIGAEITEIEGTGLGLAVAKKLTKAMNGTIGVESKIGVGSTFWIELPQAEGQSERHERHYGSTKPDDEKAGVSGTILYVEDNMDNIRLVEDIIKEHRPSIHLLSKMYGKNTVKCATDYRPEFILLDLNLPDIHGSKVLELLKENELTKSIPVVILSADAMPKQMKKLLKSGAEDYLTKPLDVVKFLEVVDKMMQKSSNQKNNH